MFLKWLYESKGMIDNTIMPADKILSDAKQKEHFLSAPCVIESDTKGIRFNVLKIANNGNINDYIFSYKDNILYPTEYDYMSDIAIKSRSYGLSQFKFVFKHFSRLSKNTIPIGTELQIEFLPNSPDTLSSNTRKHNMLLIQYANSPKYTAQYGKLVTYPSEVSTLNRDEYAKELKISVPATLFSGVMCNEESFKQGIVSSKLKKLFNERKSKFTWDNLETLYDQIKELVLSVPSIYEGLDESVIIKSDDTILKWERTSHINQPDITLFTKQVKEDSPTAEQQYWDNVKKAALSLSESVEVNTESEMLAELAKKLKSYKPTFSHSKKLTENIKDDIQSEAKPILLKKLPGNNGCLIIGQFRVLTIGHVALIKQALNTFDKVCVCLVTPKELQATQDMRNKMLADTFGDTITIINTASDNINRILDKVPFNINVISAGSDDVNKYEIQTSGMPGITVQEVYRPVDDVSASIVIANLYDEAFFKMNTPFAIHDMYESIKAVYAE